MDLQKGPSGILGWFGLKVTGRNPPGFGDSVLPVVEVGDNYLATSELNAVNTTTNAGIGVTFAQTAYTVPNGKVWRLIGAGMAGGVAAADVAFQSVIEVALKSPNIGVNSVPVGSQLQAGGMAARVAGFSFRPAIFIPSGWSVVVAIFFSAALTVAANQQQAIMYQEMDL